MPEEHRATWRLERDVNPVGRIINYYVEFGSPLHLFSGGQVTRESGRSPSGIGADSYRSGRDPQGTTRKACALRESFRRGNTRAEAYPTRNGATCDDDAYVSRLPLMGS